MKQIFCLCVSVVILTMSLTGCSLFYLPDVTYPPATWEELEAYQVLTANIPENASLEEMLDAFHQMCQVPMETTCDIYIYDVYAYEYEGQHYLHFMVSRQFELRGYYEFLDMGFSATFILDDDIAELYENKRIENDWDSLYQYIQDSTAYQTLLTKSITKRSVSIDSW